MHRRCWATSALGCFISHVHVAAMTRNQAKGVRFLLENVEKSDHNKNIFLLFYVYTYFDVKKMFSSTMVYNRELR